MATTPIDLDHHQVRLRPQLLAQGYTDPEIRCAVRRGEWERPARGTIAPAQVPGADKYEIRLNRYLRRVVARALRRPNAVISHISAAAWLGLPTASHAEDTVHLTRIGTGGGERGEGFVQHIARLRDGDVVEVGGQRVTSAARTLVDVARTESQRRAVAVADAALGSQLVTGAEVVETLGMTKYQAGFPRACRALSLADGRSESVAESATRLLLGEVGLPRPEVQINVYAEDGMWLARCDMGYLELGVLIEFDGYVKYERLVPAGESASSVVVAERQRENRLHEAGFVVVRITWDDLSSPRTLAAKVRRAMELGRRNVAAWVVTGRCVPQEPLLVPLG